MGNITEHMRMSHNECVECLQSAAQPDDDNPRDIPEKLWSKLCEDLDLALECPDSYVVSPNENEIDALEEELGRTEYEGLVNESSG